MLLSILQNKALHSLRRAGLSQSQLLTAELVGDLDDVLLAQAELLQQVVGGAGEAEDVVDADDGMLLAGDDLTAC